jgi:hypothetical protein
MGSFFTTIKKAFNNSRSVSQHNEVHPEAVRVPVTEAEPENKSGRLADARASDDQAFDVHQGPMVTTVADLADALDQAPKETFRHHISNQHNDFAVWIREVFNDEAAAAVVESARNPSEVVYILDTLSQ